MKDPLLKGFTLTEVIIVLTISLIIIVAVFSAYDLSQKSYIAAERKAEIIQNGRVVLERMSREIRQAKEIVTELPSERISPPSEIKFRDGHIAMVSEESTAQGGSANSIILDSGASNENDYYKDMFIKILGGEGSGQIRKIASYDGTAKIAQVEINWEINPDISSAYKIDTSFYYINYNRDSGGNIWRKVSTYCFSIDTVNCSPPESYVDWSAIPPGGQALLEIVLETPRVIGEYVTNLEFWGDRAINIFLTLEKKNSRVDLQTKVFGRNL